MNRSTPGNGRDYDKTNLEVLGAFMCLAYIVAERILDRGTSQATRAQPRPVHAESMMPAALLAITVWRRVVPPPMDSC